jgi:hypothetical protein
VDTIPRLGRTGVVADLVSGGSDEERFLTGYFGFNFFAYGCGLRRRVFFARGIGAGCEIESQDGFEIFGGVGECRREKGSEK